MLLLKASVRQYANGRKTIFSFFLKIFGHDATGFVFHHFACVLLCHRVHGFSAVVTIDISWPPACPLSTVTQSRYTVR